MKKKTTGEIDMFDVIELFDDLERNVTTLNNKGYSIELDEDGLEWLRESWKTYYEYFPTLRKHLPILYPTEAGDVFCEWNLENQWIVNFKIDLLSKTAIMYAEHHTDSCDTFTNKFDFNKDDEKEWKHVGFELNNFVNCV